MTDIQHNIETVEATPKTHAGNKYAWAALVLTIGAWCILMMHNGYVALAVGALAVAAGFFGLRDSSTAIKRLSISAIIASTVLIVVLTAFLIVIKIGMSA